VGINYFGPQPPVMWIKAAMEPDNEWKLITQADLKPFTSSRHMKIDWLFAEASPIRSRYKGHHVDMRNRRRGNERSIDRWFQCFHVFRYAAVRRWSNFVSAFQNFIAGNSEDSLAMERANATGAVYLNSKHPVPRFSLSRRSIYMQCIYSQVVTRWGL
jgi:hypothetical protein